MNTARALIFAMMIIAAMGEPGDLHSSSLTRIQSGLSGYDDLTTDIHSAVSAQNLEEHNVDDEILGWVLTAQQEERLNYVDDEVLDWVLAAQEDADEEERIQQRLDEALAEQKWMTEQQRKQIKDVVWEFRVTLKVFLFIINLVFQIPTPIEMVILPFYDHMMQAVEAYLLNEELPTTASLLWSLAKAPLWGQVEELIGNVKIVKRVTGLVFGGEVLKSHALDKFQDKFEKVTGLDETSFLTNTFRFAKRVERKVRRKVSSLKIAKKIRRKLRRFRA